MQKSFYVKDGEHSAPPHDYLLSNYSAKCILSIMMRTKKISYKLKKKKYLVKTIPFPQFIVINSHEFVIIFHVWSKICSATLASSGH